MESILSALGVVLDRVINYGTVILGLGFVIFLHELGHFLVAKWNDVKVEKFSIGFGPALAWWRRGLGFKLGFWPLILTWRAGRGLRVGGAAAREFAEMALHGRPGDPEAAPADPPANANVPEPASPGPVGETEYALAIIPLGGFVKMLGEGDEAHEEAEKSLDPRAYPNKPVGARMAIISAGVIMNVILGLACFIAAYGRGGMEITPARIGAVVAGMPAYEQGLREGDEIVAVDGRGDIDYTAMRRLTALSGPGEVLHLMVRRPGHEELIAIDVEPQRDPAMPMKGIGFLPTEGLELANPPYIAPAGAPNSGDAINKALRRDDLVVAAGPLGEEPVTIADSFELHALLARYRDRPMKVVVERRAKSGDAKTGGGDAPKTERVEATLPVVPFVDLGLRLEMGPVASIRPDSPAAEAGFRVGDRIIEVDGREDFDPMRLPDLAYERAGQTLTFQVLRSEGGKPAERITLTATPNETPVWTTPAIAAEPLEVPGLGLAYPVGPKIAAVRPGSPAEKAGLEPGRVIRALILSKAGDAGEIVDQPPLVLDGKELAWPAAFEVLQRRKWATVRLTIDGSEDPARLTPEEDASWHNPLRGLQFYALSRPLPPMGMADALRRGLEETRETIADVFKMIRSLALGDISPKALSGPVGIVDVASKSARMGMPMFLWFLGMLSLNLAVINFLPIPPLDGGQMAFLIAEKLRGRPLPDRALIAGTWIGLFLVLGLMVFVLVQDVMNYLP